MEMADSQNDWKSRHTCPRVRSLYFHKLSLFHYTCPVLNYQEQEVRRPSIFSCFSEGVLPKIEIAKLELLEILVIENFDIASNLHQMTWGKETVDFVTKLYILKYNVLH